MGIPQTAGPQVRTITFKDRRYLKSAGKEYTVRARVLFLNNTCPSTIDQYATSNIIRYMSAKGLEVATHSDEPLHISLFDFYQRNEEWAHYVRTLEEDTEKRRGAALLQTAWAKAIVALSPDEIKALKEDIIGVALGNKVNSGKEV